MPFRSAKKKSGVGLSGSTGQSNSKRVGRAGMSRSGGGRMRGSESIEVPPEQTPNLGTPIISAILATTATATTPTNTTDGTFYWVVSLDGTPPSQAQIKVGDDFNDLAGVDAGNAAAANPNVALITGLTAATAYFFHAYQDTTAAGASAVVSSIEFTTAA